jgi:hypothetical protein
MEIICWVAHASRVSGDGALAIANFPEGVNPRADYAARISARAPALPGKFLPRSGRSDELD